MFLSMKIAVTLGAITSLLILPTYTSNPLSCQDITLSVSASANNLIVPPFDPTKPVSPTELLATAADVAAHNRVQNINGTFSISGRYCPAPSPCASANSQIMEVLIHGSTYTKDYWSGGGFPNTGFNPDPYSWIKYAHSRNYATLSLDSLGNGYSSHPDPLSIVQPPLQSEIIHKIISQLRTGIIGNITYPYIVLIGHSAGSHTASLVASTHPSDIAALILTGYSSASLSNNRLSETFAYAPAAKLLPQRFENLSQSYLTMSNSTGRQNAFYYNGNYDPVIPPLDFANEGTIAIGEPFGTIIKPVIEYTGPVLLVAGDHDAVACGNDNGGSCLPKENCTVAKTTARYFPKARSKEFFLVNGTGYSLNFHYSARQTFKAVHDWIDARNNGTGCTDNASGSGIPP